jgi:hypothetical protein
MKKRRKKITHPIEHCCRCEASWDEDENFEKPLRE